MYTGLLYHGTDGQTAVRRQIPEDRNRSSCGTIITKTKSREIYSSFSSPVKCLLPTISYETNLTSSAETKLVDRIWCLYLEEFEIILQATEGEKSETKRGGGNTIGHGST
jgi:hypothetical protein